MKCRDGLLPVTFTAQMGPVWPEASTKITAPIGLDHDIPDCSFVVNSAAFGGETPAIKPRLSGGDFTPSEARAIAARTLRMKVLPFVSSGSPRSFIASDRKCAAEFQAALPVEGVEAKKTLADIISLCGATVDSKSRIESFRIDGEWGLVSIFESDVKGWVPRTWIWVPDQVYSR